MIKVDQLLSRLQHCLLPAQCMSCGDPGSAGLDLCAGCRQDLPDNSSACLRCALPLPRAEALCGECLHAPPPFSSAFVPFRYDWPLDRLISALKFNHSLAAGRLLAQLFIDAWQGRSKAESLPDVLVPVPLHVSRLRERGYNQALELARPIARGLQIPLRPALLSRHRATQAQVNLAASARRRNLQGAFTAGDVQAQRVVLFDDVMTTGSTLVACAQTLLAAGAAEVGVWAIARAAAAGGTGGGHS